VAINLLNEWDKKKINSIYSRNICTNERERKNHRRSIKLAITNAFISPFKMYVSKCVWKVIGMNEWAVYWRCQILLLSSNRGRQFKYSWLMNFILFHLHFAFLRVKINFALWLSMSGRDVYENINKTSAFHIKRMKSFTRCVSRSVSSCSFSHPALPMMTKVEMKNIVEHDRKGQWNNDGNRIIKFN
jgi:hypothetical protein